MKNSNKNIIATLYICKGKNCIDSVSCGLTGKGRCFHTTEIEYAAYEPPDDVTTSDRFKETAPGFYVEKMPGDTETKHS